MIDNLTILISTIMTIYVLWRAVVLDRKLPWFPDKNTPADKPVEAPKRQYGRPLYPVPSRTRKG